MLAKLIKHEFKQSYFIMLTLSAITIVLFGLAALLGSDGSFSSLVGIGVIAYLASAVYLFVILIKSTTTRMFGDTGILTFTTPATTHQILICKIFVNFLYWILFIGLSCCVVFSIGVYIEGVLAGSIFDGIFDYIGGYLVLLGIVAMIFALVTFILQTCILMFVSAYTYSCVSSSKKILLVIIFYFIVNWVINLLSTNLNIIPYGITIINDKLYTVKEGTEDVIILLSYNQIFFNLLFATGAYFSTYYFIEKKLSI